MQQAFTVSLSRRPDKRGLSVLRALQFCIYLLSCYSQSVEQTSTTVIDLAQNETELKRNQDIIKNNQDIVQENKEAETER